MNNKEIRSKRSKKQKIEDSVDIGILVGTTKRETNEQKVKSNMDID